MASRSRSRRLRRLKRWLRDLRDDPRGTIRDDPRQFALALAAVVAVLATLLFIWESYRAFGALGDAEERAEILQENIVNGDVDAARRSLELLDESASRAHGNTDGPRWWLAAQVPILGRNVDAVRIVAREIDQISDDVLPGVVDVADKVRLETFRPKDGRINLEEVAAAAPVLVTANEVLSEGNREVADFDVDGLIGPLRGPMRSFQDRFASTAVAASAANDAAKLMPTMLGADGTKRTYLLLILNNAEVRSLVGMPGSVAVLTAEDGTLEMGEQGGISDVKPLKKAAAKLTEDERIVFQSSIATDMRDTAIHPDFPRVAELAAAVVGKRWKDEYDGVVAIDPVAMGYMLGGLGPVNVGDDLTINSTNAVSTLLNRVYVRYPTDPIKQDDVFETAARRIFDATVEGTGDSVSVIRALVRGVSERRVMLWSRDDAEQKRIRRSGVANTLDSGSGRPQIGVFVNDNGATKMEYYLRMGTRLRSEECLDGGTQRLRVTTTLTSDAPPNVARLSLSIVGLNRFVSQGNMKLGVMIFGPRGGDILSMTVDGQRAPVGAAELGQRPVAKVARELPPGQSSVIVTEMETPSASPGDPELRTTPGVVPNDDSAAPSSCDS